MNASIFPSHLVGRVYHIVSKYDIESCNSEKRRRALGRCNESSSSFHRGFIFVPEDPEGEHTDVIDSVFTSRYKSHGNGIPLVIPFSSLRVACWAATAGNLIEISLYSLISYRDSGSGELIFVRRSHDHRNDIMNSEFDGSGANIVIEVHKDGIRVTPSEKGECIERINKRKITLPAMTLEALASKESQYESSSGSTKKRSIGKESMNVFGTVDAISPILINDPREEPFAIIELYQLPRDELNTDVKSAVAVIRGEHALRMHPAIHPGQLITLIGVVSRKWKVPDEFQKHLNSHREPAPISDLYQRLNHRVPDRVLLISDPETVCWNDEHQMAGSMDMSLSSTVESLTSVRGIVKSVHYHVSNIKDEKIASHVAHFVDLTLLTPAKEATLNDRFSPVNDFRDAVETTADDQKSARIYLLKYSMSPNLSLGLQPGSILRAVNIHFITPSDNPALCENVKQTKKQTGYYVACLRSTLAIERCAGESLHRAQSSISRFVPREKAFSLVPDHRITEVCCDPFNTKAAAQLLAEEIFRRELEIKIALLSSYQETPSVVEHAQRPIAVEDHSSMHSEHSYNTHTPSQIVNALLAHHNRTVKLSGDIFQDRYHMKRMINGERNGRLTIRNPYTEFFDHAHNEQFGKATECGSSYNEVSCLNQYRHFQSISMPFVVGLEDLRNACAQNLMSRVSIFYRSRLRDNDPIKDSYRVSSGFTSSHCYEGLYLLQVLNDYARSHSRSGHSKPWCDASNNSMHTIFVWGSGTDDNRTASFRDGTCQIPICKLRNRAPEHDEFRAFKHENNGVATWMEVGAVVVTCLCLGPILNENEDENIFFNNDECEDNSSRRVLSHCFLPSMQTNIKPASTDGHGFVFLVDNLAFIGSVHIAATSFVSIDRNKILKDNSKAIKDRQKSREIAASDSSFVKLSDSLSVRECLERTASNGLLENPAVVFGRLLRQRWTFRRLNLVQIGRQLKRCYSGWTIAISHIESSASDSGDEASVLQTLQLGISIEFDEFNQNRTVSLEHSLRKLIGDSVGKMITPDQLTMGLAWWIASENCRTAPLLSGGLALNLPVHVEIPHKSCTFSNLGYQRFRCSLDDMNASFVSEPRRSRELSVESLYSASTHATVLEFCSSGQFLQGILTRRLGRVPPFVGKTPGATEPLIRARNGCTLLKRLKCQGSVPSATLSELHWDICSSLKEGDHSHLKPSLLRRIHNTKVLGISFARAQVECMQCYKPLISDRPSKRPRDNSNVSPSREETIIFCPSGCSRSHGAVKWECSALIDDGTGQARLYADRESALLLLGDSLNVEAIETGAWELDEGVFYQPALPSSSHLLQCIADASRKAKSCTIRSNNGELKQGRSCNGSMPSIFNMMPIAAKAEYLLQQHCRQWYQHNHQRKMDLFCRCKPLSEHVTSVNQTEIDIAKAWIAKVGVDFGSAPTSSLPPLNLILEDACLAAEESYDDNISGWCILGHLSDHNVRD